MFDRKTHCKNIASKGGKTTSKKYGKDHMRAIGKKGAESTWAKYTLQPVGLNNFALVEKETGEVKAYLNGGWYE